MPRYCRHRSSSVESCEEGDKFSADKVKERWSTTKTMFSSLLYMKDSNGRAYLHTAFENDLYLAKCLLDRCRVLDDHEEAMALPLNRWQERFLLQPNQESGYTPLHAAIIAKDLAAILLYLHYPSPPTGPMTVLHAGLTGVAKAVDAEGLTPLELLGKLQTSNLKLCRASLPQPLLSVKSSNRRQQRSISFDYTRHEEDEEYDVLRENMHLLGPVRDDTATSPVKPDDQLYGFEVVTFGRPHHCALGVISSSSGGSNIHRENKSDADKNPAVAAATFRPQRVQEFGQERVLREGSAVAVAAATHHTLVACRNGHLYVFGLNKGGRLGLGDDCPQQCPLPRRIMVLKRRHVVAIAAAENHSLCVTSEGLVYAWGNNQFGQLGDSPNNTSSTTSRSIPKQVDELKHTPCVAVAAGERHSVALSKEGEVYVWGSNTSGQLGVPRRSGVQKVQRVDSLWATGSSSYQQQRKVAIAIAAADQSTLVLIAPVIGLTQVNSVFWWGHGNHVPMRVQFEGTRSSTTSLELPGAMTASQRLVNPVAIACAKYHNAAVTVDGCVYTWGTSAESLGRESGQNSPGVRTTGHRATVSPQLVAGMLPENGGGFVVAVSASEQHTAVVTDTGALFTWGVAHGKNVMGHEGVRWQPSPKRVPGVHRAVDVAVAKEHTVVLIGTTFPVIPPTSGLSSLESFAAHTVARHVDLFNVIPVYIMAEHTQCDFLIEFCSEFVRQNLDGVLTVGKKSVLNQYLNDMLAKNMHRVSFKCRDDHHHPFITDVVTVGHVGRPTFHREWLSTTEEWIRGCQELSKSSVVRQFLALASIHEHDGLIRLRQGRLRASSSCASESEAMTGRTRSLSYPSEEEHRPQAFREGTLDRIINKTANMDLSTSDLAQEKSIWLAKEIRAVRKKLNQITKLRDAEAKSIVLTSDEQAKLDRHPVLEAELHIYQTALDEVEKRIHELISVDQHKCQVATTDDTIESEDNVASCKSSKNVDEGKPVSKSFEQESLESSYSCEICGIKCPDNTSFELHQNGRKHRNRMLQVEEKEKQRAAQSIIAQKQLEQVKSPTETISIASTKKNAWGVSSTPPPKFKLPPPPHPVVAQVVTPTTIAVKNTLFAPSLKVSPVPNFQNILGQKEAIKERAPNQTPLQQKAVSPVWTKSTQSPVSNRSPFHLHPAPNLTLQPPSSGQRSSYSLGDFLAPKPTVKPTPKVTPTVVAWTSPAKAIRNEALTVKPKSLAEIQAEEVDFKAREDRAYVCSDGKESSWFIERRERADSLHAIQQAAEVERETQLMIQEQLEIEAQIKKEIAAQRKKEKEQHDKKAGSIVKRPKKRNNPNKKNSKDTESPSNQRSQESALAASKPQKPQSSKPGGGRSSRGPKKAIISHSESC